MPAVGATLFNRRARAFTNPYQGTGRRFRKLRSIVRARHLPYWFVPQYATYAGKQEILPVDQHALVALVAPRGYHGADPRGSWLSLVEASRAWALCGKAAVLKDSMPLVNDLLLQGPMAYHIRERRPWPHHVRLETSPRSRRHAVQEPGLCAAGAGDGAFCAVTG
jgi:hypothetical protein